MTKQKITLILAVAVLGLVANVIARDAWAQATPDPTPYPSPTATPVPNAGLLNTDLVNTDPNTRNAGAAIGGTNDGNISVGHGTTATTTSVSVDGTVSGQEVVHTDLTVGFPIEVASDGGSVRVLIPTALDGTTAAGGQPAAGVFILPTDYVDSTSGAITGTASEMFTCPAVGGGATFAVRDVTVVIYDGEKGEYVKVDTLKSELPVEPGETDPRELDPAKDRRYLAYTCTYTGVPTRGGPTEVTSTQVDDDYKIVIKDLINPLAEHKENNMIQETLNEAITTPGKVQLFDAADPNDAATTMMSNMDVLISTVQQDVLVKAKVEYQLMFRIDGVEAGDTTIECDNKPSVSSSPLRIDYGAASIGVPVDAAQRIYVNSSVAEGYKITMTQNRNMRRQDTHNDITDANYQTLCYLDDGLIDGNNINRDCIPNFGWNKSGGSLSPAESQTWSDADAAGEARKTGFGYTVARSASKSDEEVVDTKNTGRVNGMFDTEGASETTTGSKGGGTYYTRIATRNSDGTAGIATRGAAGTADPTLVAFSDHLSTGEYYDVCYRLVVDGQNNAGVYDNEVTYTITASL